MYHYNKYIARHLIHSTLLIAFSLTSIVWLTQALRFIDFIVNQGVSILVFLKLTGLLIPSLLLMILPPALFCAVLFTYNKLKSESELIVMQAIGLSRWRLGLPAIEVGMAVMACAYAISLYLLPVSYTRFREMQNYLRNNYASIMLQEGVFNSPMDGLTVFIRSRDHSGILHGILVHDNRNLEAPVTMMAEDGKLVQTPQGPRFLLMHGNRQAMSSGRLSLLNFQDYTLDISMDSQEGKERADAQELFLSQLFTYDPNISAIDNAKRRAEGHQRLLWPGYSLSLTLVALSVLLSGQFNRRGAWKRIALAVIFGTAMMFAAVGLRGAMAIHPAMVAVAYLCMLLPVGFAAWVLSDTGSKRRLFLVDTHPRHLRGAMA